MTFFEAKEKITPNESKGAQRKDKNGIILKEIDLCSFEHESWNSKFKQQTGEDVPVHLKTKGELLTERVNLFSKAIRATGI